MKKKSDRIYKIISHVWCSNLFTQYSLWSNYFIEDVFSHMCVHSTKCIIQEVDISIKIHSSCQTDTLFLTSTQINALYIEQ